MFQLSIVFKLWTRKNIQIEASLNVKTRHMLSDTSILVSKQDKGFLLYI